MMMVETGEADAFITGLYTKYSNTIKVAKEVIGIRPVSYTHLDVYKRQRLDVTFTLASAFPNKGSLIVFFPLPTGFDNGGSRCV